MKDVLHNLDNEADGHEFSDIKSHVDDLARREAILGRVGHAKAVAENFTPKAIKALRPDIPGCVLVWQYMTGSFQGYYPIAKPKPVKEGSKKKPKTHYSRSRSYNIKRTKIAALLEIVRWLWKLHQECGGETEYIYISKFCLSCFGKKLIFASSRSIQITFLRKIV